MQSSEPWLDVHATLSYESAGHLVLQQVLGQNSADIDCHTDPLATDTRYIMHPEPRDSPREGTGTGKLSKMQMQSARPQNYSLKEVR